MNPLERETTCESEVLRKSRRGSLLSAWICDTVQVNGAGSCSQLSSRKKENILRSSFISMQAKARGA